MQNNGFHWIIFVTIVITATAGYARNATAGSISNFSAQAQAPVVSDAGAIGQSIREWVRGWFDGGTKNISVDQVEVSNLNDEITESTGVNLIQFFKFIGSILLQILSWISSVIQWFLNWLPGV